MNFMNSNSLAGLGSLGAETTYVDQAKAIFSTVKDIAGKLGIGGITQDRFLARRDEIYSIFRNAGYPNASDPSGASYSTVFKILAADIPDRLTDRTYAKEFQRLHNYTAARLNLFNPGLGAYWGTSFPFVMANKGNIFGAPIDILKKLVEMFPPGTYKGERPFPPLPTIAPVTDAPAGFIREVSDSFTFLKDAQGQIKEVRDAAGNILNPGTPQYNAAINDEQSKQAGFGTVGTVLLLSAIAGTAMVTMNGGDKKKTAS